MPTSDIQSSAHFAASDPRPKANCMATPSTMPMPSAENTRTVNDSPLFFMNFNTASNAAKTIKTTATAAPTSNDIAYSFNALFLLNRWLLSRFIPTVSIGNLGNRNMPSMKNGGMRDVR